MGIQGNEEADAHAKRAARKEASEARELPRSLRNGKRETRTLLHSKAALKQHFYARIKSEAITVMKKSPRYILLNSIDPLAPSKKFEEKTEKQPR